MIRSTHHAASWWTFFSVALNATIRQLGYPTKNALKGWHMEYLKSQDVRAGYERSWQKYSGHQKRIAVDHFMEHGQCMAFTMRTLGYPSRETLKAWINDSPPELRRHIVTKAANVQHAPVHRAAAFLDLCTRQTSAKAIAKKLAVSRPALYNWKNQLLGREAPASMKRQNTLKPDTHPTRLSELQQQVVSLERDIRRLQLERVILNKSNELLKKGLGVSPKLLSNREKTILIDALKNTYTLAELLVELELARSSYFYHCGNLRRPDKYADARFAIADVFNSNHRCYGYRRMRAALGRRNLHISEKVLQRLMKQECLIVGANRRRRYGSYLGEISPAPENVINRDFGQTPRMRSG